LQPGSQSSVLVKQGVLVRLKRAIRVQASLEAFAIEPAMAHVFESEAADLGSTKAMFIG
jgi:hypothetical protein